MKHQDIIKAIAELDGYVCKQASNSTTWALFNQSGERAFEWHDTPERAWEDAKLLRYLTSRDAIVPVIEKQAGCVIDKITEWLRQTQIAWIGTNMYLAKAELLCEALLRATDKWKD